MPISYVGAGAVASGSNPAVAVPAGVTTGDLLLIMVTSGGVSSTISGWTRVINQNSNRQLTVFTRVATSSEPSPVTVTNSNTGTKAVMVAYRSTTGSLVNISTFNNGTSTSPSTNSVTTTSNVMTVVSFYGINNNSTKTFTAPASTTTRVNSGSTNAGVNGLLIVDEVQTTAGASSTRTATISASDSWSAIAFTLQEPARNLYWVGGSGTWDTSATGNWALTSNGTSGAAAPTAIDNVFIDTSSGTGTITCTGGVCNDLTVTASQAITLGTTGSTYSVFGNLTFPSGGSFSASTGTPTIVFAATTTGETITTNGKSLASVVFNGVGGGWTLGSDLTTTGSITLTNGTLDTSSSGNYAITCTIFNSSNSNVRTLNLNASTVTITFNGSGTVWNCATSTNLTLNAGTSTISIATGQPTFAGGGRTYNNLVFTNTTASPITISGVNTFNNLTFTSRTTDGVGSITIDANQTVTGTLTLGTSNTAVRRFLVASSAVGTARTLTVATIATLSDVDFRDITAAGASGTWSGTRLGNCLGNTNITFNAGKTVYWNLAGTQNWAAVGWATTNNGTPALNNFPLAQDTAVFTEAGSAGTVSLNSGWNIGTIQMADGISNRTTTFTLAFNSPINLYGSFIAFSGLNTTGANTLGFRGQGVTQDFNSAGVSLSFPISINNTTGTLRLLSDLTTTSGIILVNGTFNANSYNVTATSYSSSGTTSSRTTVMGNGLWTLTGTGNVWSIGSSDTFTKGTSDIVLSNTTTTSRTFFSGGFTYNKLTIGGTTGTSTLNISSGVGLSTTAFSEIASTKTVAHTITFGEAITIGTWSVSGSSGNLVTVNSSTSGTQRTITVTNKITTADYLVVQDINSPTLNPITFWAGANSTNNGNNTNIVFADGASTSAYVRASGTSFVAPADWNSSSNAIYLFGGGGGSAGSGSGNGTNRTGGAGGGGGAYTKLSNVSLTPSTSYTIAIGAGGTGGASRLGTNGTSTAGTGGNTTFNDGSNTYTANGGLGGSISTNVPSSTGGTGGTAQTVSGLITEAFAGGAGGSGGVNTNSLNNSAGGGGGAGGPNGIGGNGGNGVADSNNTDLQAGGGGGNSGGSAGGNGIANSPFGGGAGGNNSLGLGGGAARTTAGIGNAGSNGGGGSGGTGAGFRGGIGGNGIDVLGGLGSGGGSGGSTTVANTGATAGLYGAGAGGSGNGISQVYAGIAGAQGAIIIVYSVGGSPVISSNFFFFFG